MPDNSRITLNSAQIASYREQGFLIVKEVLDDREVSWFLEREAQPKPPDLRPGLHTHKVDPAWKYVAKHPNVAGVSAQLLGGRPRIVQTMYLPKPPAKVEGEPGGRGIALHQDTHYLPSEPNTLMACWIALNDTDGGNGGLCVVPGSHRGNLKSAHKNENIQEHASWTKKHQMEDRDGNQWIQTMVSFQIDAIDPEAVQRLEVAKGSAVLFTGMTVHGSYANRSVDRSRLAFAVHFVREGTWLQRKDVQETEPVIDYSDTTRFKQ